MKNTENSVLNESVNETPQVDTFVDTSTVVETTTERQKIGARMKAARKSLGLSQAGFAAQHGFNLRTYQGNEAGYNEAGITLGAAFSRAGINANWLLTGEGPMRIEDLQAAKTPDSLDRERMRLAMEAVEEGLSEAKLTMVPAKKAELLLAAYDLLETYGVTKEKVMKIVKLAA